MWRGTGSYLVSSSEFEVFYDGACPLCTREVRWLRRRDWPGRITFSDIAGPGFDAAALGVSPQMLMARIHGRLPDGSWVVGVDVFRHLYRLVGLGPLVAFSELPGVSHLLDVAYGWFARHRLRLTGRCDSSRCAAHAPDGRMQ